MTEYIGDLKQTEYLLGAFALVTGVGAAKLQSLQMILGYDPANRTIGADLQNHEIFVTDPNARKQMSGIKINMYNFASSKLQEFMPKSDTSYYLGAFDAKGRNPELPDEVYVEQTIAKIIDHANIWIRETYKLEGNIQSTLNSTQPNTPLSKPAGTSSFYDQNATFWQSAVPQPAPTPFENSVTFLASQLANQGK